MHYERCPKCGGSIRAEKCTVTGREQWTYYCPACQWLEDVDGGIALWKALQVMNRERDPSAAAGGRGVLQTILTSEDPAAVKESQARLVVAGIEAVISEEERTRELVDICWETGHVRRETESYRVKLLQVPEKQAQAAHQVLCTGQDRP
jgi:hypothetical protein